MLATKFASKVTQLTIHLSIILRIYQCRTNSAASPCSDVPLLSVVPSHLFHRDSIVCSPQPLKRLFSENQNTVPLCVSSPLQLTYETCLSTRRVLYISSSVSCKSLSTHSMSPFRTRIVTPSDTYRTPFSDTSPPLWFKTRAHPTGWAAHSAHSAHLSMLGEECEGWEEQCHHRYGSALYSSRQAYDRTHYASMEGCKPIIWYGIQRSSRQQYRNGGENVQIRRRKGEMRVVRRKGK
jgi:hypothetical protein